MHKVQDTCEILARIVIYLWNCASSCKTLLAHHVQDHISWESCCQQHLCHFNKTLNDESHQNIKFYLGVKLPSPTWVEGTVLSLPVYLFHMINSFRETKAPVHINNLLQLFDMRNYATMPTFE